MNKISVGSVCSGIEAASVAWNNSKFNFKWFSEIADFPSQVLNEHYPYIPNVGDMINIPKLLENNDIEPVDFICGGTPCQAFSFAGWKQGLSDDRGNLTLKFVDIVNTNDKIRNSKKLNKSIVMWENVEGVLTDKTNAFGIFISSLAGLDEPIKKKKWNSAGILRGKDRNIAWRVLDAKYFGLPQQRKRLYVIATDKKYNPEDILFELHDYKNVPNEQYNQSSLIFEKENSKFQVFREYTDVLYSAYGTKWNGNAAANNGSLFVSQDDRLRRLSPLECERLMGFPDNYTKLPKASRTSRYQALGNSWAVPVIEFLGKQITNYYNNFNDSNSISQLLDKYVFNQIDYIDNHKLFLFSEEIEYFDMETSVNASSFPESIQYGFMKDIVTKHDVPEKIYISPTGCHGILRRAKERNNNINSELEKLLVSTSKKLSEEEIFKISTKQKRGRYSAQNKEKVENNDLQLTIF